MLLPNIDLNRSTVLVTGAAGFIGSYLVKRLLTQFPGAKVVGIDSITDYYDTSLKYERIREIDALNASVRTASNNGQTKNINPAENNGQTTTATGSWTFIKASIADKTVLENVFDEYDFDVVVNLAAQAGVRYSITNPDAYIESNLIGFYNILEACRRHGENNSENQGKQNGDTSGNTSGSTNGKQNGNTSGSTNGEQYGNTSGTTSGSTNGEQNSEQNGNQTGTPRGIKHLIYASSSSVYGGNTKVPYSTDDKVDNPVSLYAATKKSNELLAHSYSKLYNIPCTGLRFFTVYGPAGRPDMAYFSFTEKLIKGDTIKIFNYGNCRRDFTYIDDIVEGIVRVAQHAPEKSNGADGLPVAPYMLYNIGNSHPENLLDFVGILQEELVRAGVLPADYDFDAHKRLVPMQPGDVPATFADTAPLERDFGFRPSTPLRTGLRNFAEWYKTKL